MATSAPERTTAPDDADARRGIPPVVCYPEGAATMPQAVAIDAARRGATVVDTHRVAPRDGLVVPVAKGRIFRIRCLGGSQVGDLNLWNADDLSERFYSGKTRALHGAHVSTGARLWSGFPALRPLAAILHDTLAWYGVDRHGMGVHDVIGTRCDPYTHRLLSGGDYDRCCHSNLTRALADATGLTRPEAEPLVHDVLNVFMCTGFDAATHRYMMKASPARAGDYLEFLAEIDLLVGLSACPGGDCGAEHSSDAAECHPLEIEVLETAPGALDNWPWVGRNGYEGGHGP